MWTKYTGLGEQASAAHWQWQEGEGEWKMQQSKMSPLVVAVSSLKIHNIAHLTFTSVPVYLICWDIFLQSVTRGRVSVLVIVLFIYNIVAPESPLIIDGRPGHPRPVCVRVFLCVCVCVCMWVAVNAKCVRGWPLMTFFSPFVSRMREQELQRLCRRTLLLTVCMVSLWGQLTSASSHRSHIGRPPLPD